MSDSSAAVGVSSELHSAIVIQLRHRIRTAIKVRAVFAVRVLENHHLIAFTISVFYSRCILAFVVLEDKLLLALLDIFPIRLEGNIQDGISAKH